MEPFHKLGDGAFQGVYVVGKATKFVGDCPFAFLHFWRMALPIVHIHLYVPFDKVLLWRVFPPGVALAGFVHGVHTISLRRGESGVKG